MSEVAAAGEVGLFLSEVMTENRYTRRPHDPRASCSNLFRVLERTFPRTRFRLFVADPGPLRDCDERIVPLDYRASAASAAACASPVRPRSARSWAWRWRNSTSEGASTIARTITSKASGRLPSRQQAAASSRRSATWWIRTIPCLKLSETLLRLGRTADVVFYAERATVPAPGSSKLHAHLASLVTLTAEARA